MRLRFDASKFFLTVVFVILVLTPSLQAQGPGAMAAMKSDAAAQPIAKNQLLSPEQLVKILESGESKPLILNVGPRMLFAQARIPGAVFIGPGSDSQSLETLRQRVKSLPKTTAIVLYCGCCPWEHCPNVRPAFNQLRALGFTRVKVLYIANNFGVDWVYKGYPTEK